MISRNSSIEEILRHLGLTEPLETGSVLGIQITKEGQEPMTVHVRYRILDATVLDEYVLSPEKGR